MIGYDLTERPCIMWEEHLPWEYVRHFLLDILSRKQDVGWKVEEKQAETFETLDEATKTSFTGVNVNS